MGGGEWGPKVTRSEGERIRGREGEKRSGVIGSTNRLQERRGEGRRGHEKMAWGWEGERPANRVAEGGASWKVKAKDGGEEWVVGGADCSEGDGREEGEGRRSRPTGCAV